MIGNLVRKFFGSRNDRLIRSKFRIVESINALEPELQALSDEQLRAKTDEFRQRLADGEKSETLLPEAFAVVREASVRVLGMRHFDVQLVGGMVLNNGKIAEMRTGEGKTLVATLPAYLNALAGEGVHVVTVNEYLARRDSDWMGKLYAFLGMTTGVVVPGMEPQAKREAYQADITYATNNELGFDYLRDNMAFGIEDRFQRGQAFAIIDEVDSILIDEARTPLVISGPTDDTSDLYEKINKLIPELDRQEETEGEEEEGEEGPGDYSVDEKNKQIFLTESGHEKVEAILIKAELLNEGESLYDANNLNLMHHVNAALRASVLYQRDVEYIVKDNEIVIVDEFTGRTMPGRRWSEGLHQAIEAKEGVAIQKENQTLASITFQNYFRLYRKLSGMTGTADTEAFEFQQIYGLEVVVVPTHRPMVRKDNGDMVFLTAEEKYDAIVDDIKDCQKRGQPALVGTASIETSELISKRLKKDGIKHQVLNAKQHEKEAHIVAQAGRPGTVTIATNMAGRGTDIVLGGNLQVEIEDAGAEGEKAEQIEAEWQRRHGEVLAAGGLHIIGTERHESRRIDNQLRGRSGRQGDAGSSQFYLSLEDSLMRIFASDRVSSLMQKLGMEEGEAIEHPWVTKAIENAQRKVEGHNFDIRKNLLEFDDVANDQRTVIYEQRNELMAMDDISDSIRGLREEVVDQIIDAYIPPGSMDEQWDVRGLEEALLQELGISLEIQKWLDEDDELFEDSLRRKITEALEQEYAEKEATVGEQTMRHFEKAVMLQVVDALWKEHLAAMDHLRQGINLRGYAQKNPKQEYKREAFDMFTSLLDRIKHEVVTTVSRVKVRAEEDVHAMEEQRRRQQPAGQAQHAEASALTGEGEVSEEGSESTPFVRSGRKVGRNEPCPCGSGKKFKQCHGKLS